MDLKNKHSYIYLNFYSYNKISIKKKLIISQNFDKVILLFWLLKKQKNVIFIKFINLKKFQKKFTLLKSPKGHKTGKLLLNYQYYKYLIIIKKITKIKNLNMSIKYFKYILKLFKYIDSNYIINNKISLITTINY